MFRRIGMLACPVELTALWPDGGTSAGWVVPAGSPVWVDLGADTADGILLVHAVDCLAGFACIPEGWVEMIELTGAPTAPF